MIKGLKWALFGLRCDKGIIKRLGVKNGLELIFKGSRVILGYMGDVLGDVANPAHTSPNRFRLDYV